MFRWLARMLTQAVASSMQTAVDPRAQMFPDYGLRAESERLSASFDPFNFALHTERSHATDEEAKLIRAGKFDEAKALIAGKLGSLPERKRIGYALSVTSEAHEMRHYHDHFAQLLVFHALWKRFKTDRLLARCGRASEKFGQ